MLPVANWSFPTEIRFGTGRITELADALKSHGITRPLLVTDPGLAGLQMVTDIVTANRAAGLETAVYSDVKPNPVEANINAGVEMFRSGGHDGVIAFGGGSGLDAGKAVAFMVGQQRPIWDFEDIGDFWKRANTDAIVPIVAVPTTAGTGSEVGRAAVITNEVTATKKVIFHPKMLPRTVILDPTLTRGLPPALTAGTGMDALAHCLEAYCAPAFHPMAAGIAVEGIRLVKQSLARAVSDGHDLEARGDMLAAAAMGAVAFQKGLGAIHALSHPIGALYDTHHGTTNAVMMPYVLEMNRAEIEDRITSLSAWLKLDGFDGFLEWVLALREEVKIPHTLKELGLDKERIEEIAAKAVVDPTAGGNPVKLTEENSRALFEAAFEGTIKARQAR